MWCGAVLCGGMWCGLIKHNVTCAVGGKVFGVQSFQHTYEPVLMIMTIAKIHNIYLSIYLSTCHIPIKRRSHLTLDALLLIYVFTSAATILDLNSCI